MPDSIGLVFPSHSSPTSVILGDGALEAPERSGSPPKAPAQDQSGDKLGFTRPARLAAAVAALALSFVAQNSLNNSVLTVALFAAAIGLFALSGPPPTEPEHPAARRLVWSWTLIQPLVFGIALVVFAMAGWWFNRFSGKASGLLLLPWLGGLAIAIWGLWRLRLAETKPSRSKRTLAELLAVCAIVAAAILFRAYDVGGLPVGFWYDEADTALEAVQINAGPDYSPAAFHFHHNPSTYYHLIALFFRFGGESVFTIRILAVMCATLTVPLLYVLVRSMFGSTPALIAAFLLAFSRWHMDFSRLGTFYFSGALFAVGAIYLLWRSFKTGRWSDYAWAGLWIGFGLHGYTGFKTFPFAAAALLALWFLRSIHQWRALIPRYLFFGLFMAAAFGPVLVFTVQNPSEATERVEDASVFAGKNTNDEKLSALLANVQKHVLMFNVRGNPNGRHNLPGAPQLDPLAAAFFVVGLGFALLWVWQTRFWMLLIWFLVGMAGGILSLDFEAPQALRSLLGVPAIITFIALGPIQVWSLASRIRISLGAPAVRWAVAAATLVVIGLPASAIAYAEADMYFSHQSKNFASWAAYSTPETLIAREVQRLGAGYHFLIPDFYNGHPAIRFITPWLSDVEVVKDAQSLPLTGNRGKPVAIFLDPDKKAVFDEAQRLYPDGDFRLLTPPFSSQPLLFEAILSPAVIEGLQGLEARYYRGVGWQGEPALIRRERGIGVEQVPGVLGNGPLSVDWQGVLRVQQYGAYALSFSGSGQTQLELDGKTLTPGAGGAAAFQLAIGSHALHLRYQSENGIFDPKLEWQGPGFAKQPIAAEYLYGPPLTSNGLLGKFYAGKDWKGQPGLERIDRNLSIYFHLLPMGRPYSVDWTGFLNAPAGAYRFGLESIDDSWLYIDDKLVVEAHTGNLYVEAPATLAAGVHRIEVKFQDYTGFTHINLFWIPPGGERQIVPPEFLSPGEPAPGTLPPALPAPTTPSAAPDPAVAAPAAPVATPVPLPGLGAAPEIALTPVSVLGAAGTANGQFASARGIALDVSGNVFVADTQNRRVQKFDRNGKFVLTFGKPGTGEGEFREPVAVAINSRNELIVLDAGSPFVSRFSPDGRFLGRFTAAGQSFFSPRGLSLDASDNLYIANTGQGLVIKLDRDGKALAAYGNSGPGLGGLREPTDALVLADGSVIVVDPTLGKLVRYDPNGSPLLESSFPKASTVEGPHLAALSSGGVVASDPAGHRLLFFDRDLKLVGAFGKEGTSPGQFRVPVGIGVDREGRLLVGESAGNRVQLFKLP